MQAVEDSDNKVNAYAVYDMKAAAFMNPFFMPTDGMAIRSFTKAAIEDGHDFQLYGGDYTLFRIGSWDPVRGELVTQEPHDNLGTALMLASAYELQQNRTLQEVSNDG